MLDKKFLIFMCMFWEGVILPGRQDKLKLEIHSVNTSSFGIFWYADELSRRELFLVGYSRGSLHNKVNTALVFFFYSRI